MSVLTITEYTLTDMNIPMNTFMVIKRTFRTESVKQVLIFIPGLQ